MVEAALLRGMCVSSRSTPHPFLRLIAPHPSRDRAYSALRETYVRLYIMRAQRSVELQQLDVQTLR
jgi:hypothetical protein